MGSEVGRMQIGPCELIYFRPAHVTVANPWGADVQGSREVDIDSIAHATWEGYCHPGGYVVGEGDKRAVVASLFEHEALHVYIGGLIWGEQYGSRVMRMLSGEGNRQPFALRAFEESAVSSFARYLNLGVVETPLMMFSRALGLWGVNWAPYRQRLWPIIDAAVKP